MLNQKYTQILDGVALGTVVEENIIRTGYKRLDQKLIGGLRKGCCYLFTGLEKSGKSSFLFNVIHERLMDSLPTGILSTEMDCSDVTKRLKSIARIDESNAQDKFFWKKQVEKNFTFYGKDELTSQTDKGIRYQFPNFLKSIDEMEKDGIELVVIDNLTTLGAEAGDYKVLGSMVNQLITHVKSKNMAVIFVIHVKNDTSFRESPEGIRRMIKEGKQEEIFTESVTVVNRPTLKDVYGGGQALSQLSGGAIMLWRPFQKYDSPKFQRMAMLVIDSHRFGPSCDIYVEYDGQTGKFWEVEK